MVLWAGLLTCAALGMGHSPGKSSGSGPGPGWTDGDQGWTGTWPDGGLAGQLELYWPLELMRAQEVRCRATRVRSPQSY